MSARVRLDEPLPPDAPAAARLLWRCAPLVEPTTRLLLDVGGSDLELAGRLGALPPGDVEVRWARGLASVPVEDVPALTSALRQAGAPVLVQSVAGVVHRGEAELRSVRSYDDVRAHEVGWPQDLRELRVPVLSGRQRPHRGVDEWRTPLPPWAMRLAVVLRALRRTLQTGDLDVRWVDDGRRCRLVRVAPA